MLSASSPGKSIRTALARARTSSIRFRKIPASHVLESSRPRPAWMSTLPRVWVTSERNESNHAKLSPDSPSTQRIRVCVAGYGYWGPQVVRNFHNLQSSEVVAVCDTSSKSLQRARETYPESQVTQD